LRKDRTGEAAMDNQEIAKVFDEVADLLEITGENFFRVRAYRNAARTLSDYPQPLGEMSREELGELPGIGEDLAAKISELSAGKEIDIHRDLLKKVPHGLLDLRRIHGLGPKRIKLLHEELGVRDLPSLERAAEAGAIAKVRGLGARLEEQVLKALKERQAEPEKRMMYFEAARIVDKLLAHLHKSRAVKVLEVAGSFRRRRDTVGDLDILAVSDQPAAVMKQMIAYPGVKDTLGSGATKTSVMLSDGLQVDLRVVERKSYGAALMYFTGSKAHNVHLRRIAQGKHLLLNEYGLFKGENSVAGAEEKGVYRALGLEWIEPELREDRGEIEAAQHHQLPDLIQRKDLRGDLHTHSTWTDGRASIEEMARAAKAAGLEYYAVTDHSQRLKMARGLDAKRLREQWKEIEKVEARVGGIRMLRGIEVDVLDDGTLDLPDAVLRELDWVVASVHSKLEMDRDAMTRRMIGAIRNPVVDVIGHPSGRLIGRRSASSFDLDAVLKAAHEEECALEVNSQPERLDLTDTACIAAKHAGVKLVISSDSHATSQFEGLEFGVNQARRGWIEAQDVLTTRALKNLRPRR
jgi:DNA polymerase (family 10)